MRQIVYCIYKSDNEEFVTCDDNYNSLLTDYYVTDDLSKSTFFNTAELAAGLKFKLEIHRPKYWINLEVKQVVIEVNLSATEFV